MAGRFGGLHINGDACSFNRSSTEYFPDMVPSADSEAVVSWMWMVARVRRGVVVQKQRKVCEPIQAERGHSQSRGTMQPGVEQAQA